MRISGEKAVQVSYFLLRVVSGLLFLQAGGLKLWGWFGGMPPEFPFKLFSEIGLAGVLEFFGGSLILLGLFTRPVAFILSGEMAVAYWQGHAPHGAWPIVNHGEPAVLLCFIFLFMSAYGGGEWSLDAWIQRKKEAVMAQKESGAPNVKATGQEISATRLLDAPRDLVWKVFTEPEHVTKWYGPDGFTMTLRQMEVRTGGAWNFIFHGPDGRDYPNDIVYVEVVKPERLVMDHVSEPFHRTTITLEEKGDKTLLHFLMTFKSAEERERVSKQYGAVEGLDQNLGRLKGHLGGIRHQKEAADG